MSRHAAMRAAVYQEPGRLTIEERPIPRPGPHEVLIRISHCGVCGTDLHFVMDGWGRPGSIGGHEYSGVISSVGSDVVGWVVGDAVVAGSDVGCGECRQCRNHRVSLCEAQSDAAMAEYTGAFAEFKLVDAEQLHRIPSDLSLREAALAEPVAVSLHGITQSGIRPGQRALITGAGPVGMFTLAALRAQGVEDVTVSEPSEVRRALAERIGASRVIEPDELIVPLLPFTIVDDPYDVAFECSGKAAAIESALAALAKTGTLCLMGTGVERPQFDAMRVLLNELVVTGAYAYNEDGFARALELIGSGSLPTDLLIAKNDIGLDELLQTMQQLVAGEVAGKVLVTPN